MYIDSKIKISIRRSNFVLFSWLLFIPFIKSTLLMNIYSGTSGVVNIALIIISFILLIYLCNNTNLQKGKISLYATLIILYCLTVAPISLYSGKGRIGDIFTYWGSAFYHIVFCAFISYILKEDAKVFVHIWAIAFNIMSIANAITICVFPEGIITVMGIPYWLLGYDNQHVILYLAAIVFASLDSYLRKGKITNSYILITYIIYLVVSIRCWTVTSFIALVIFGVFIYGYPLFKKFRSIINIKTFAVIIFLATIVIITVSQSNATDSLLGRFITSVLHKDIGFNSRNWIWRNTLVEIAKHPFFGHGYETEAVFTSVIGTSHAHNEWVQMLYDGGIVHLGCYLALLCLSGQELLRNKTSPVSYVLTVYIFAILIIQMIVNYHQLQWMIAFVLAYSCKNIDNLMDAKENASDMVDTLS